MNAATKVASTAAKRTKELGLTVNESVIKPTRDKVIEGKLFDEMSSAMTGLADKVKEGTLLNDVGTSMSGFAFKLSSASTKGWQGLSSSLWGGEPKTTLATADTSPGEKTSLLGGGSGSPTKGKDPSKNRLLSEDDDSWGSWGAGDWHPGENTSSGNSGKVQSPEEDFEASSAAAAKKAEMNDLEKWLNDSHLETDSPKSQANKTPSKRSDTASEWDDWQIGSSQGSPVSTNTTSSTHSPASISKKKVTPPKLRQNNSSNNTPAATTGAGAANNWDDMADWNSSDFTGKQNEPLVGNLVDLGSDTSKAQDNFGWDNEVWAQDSDDEWQSLETSSPQTRSRIK